MPPASMPNPAPASRLRPVAGVGPAALQTGIHALNCAPPDPAENRIFQAQLLAYLALLVKWNRAYNLTGTKAPAAILSRHLLDCLAIAPHISAAAYVIDVGTGAGLPGIPLALRFPEKQFTLLDSCGKKTRFLQQVKIALGMANISIQQARAEAWQPPRRFDAVLSRAFAPLPEMLRCCEHLCSADGCFLAMKGARPDAEIAAVQPAGRVRHAHRIDVPGLDDARHLIVLAPARIDAALARDELAPPAMSRPQALAQ